MNTGLLKKGEKKSLINRLGAKTGATRTEKRDANAVGPNAADSKWFYSHYVYKRPDLFGRSVNDDILLRRNAFFLN